MPTPSALSLTKEVIAYMTECAKHREWDASNVKDVPFPDGWSSEFLAFCHFALKQISVARQNTVKLAWSMEEKTNFKGDADDKIDAFPDPPQDKRFGDINEPTKVLDSDGRLLAYFLPGVLTPTRTQSLTSAVENCPIFRDGAMNLDDIASGKIGMESPFGRQIETFAVLSGVVALLNRAQSRHALNSFESSANPNIIFPVGFESLRVPTSSPDPKYNFDAIPGLDMIVVLGKFSHTDILLEEIELYFEIRPGDLFLFNSKVFGGYHVTPRDKCMLFQLLGEKLTKH